jgi:hypothetical protein
MSSDHAPSPGKSALPALFERLEGRTKLLSVSTSEKLETLHVEVGLQLHWLPDYSEHPLRKPEIAAGVAEEFRSPQSSVHPFLLPKPEAIAMFEDVAVTQPFWRDRRHFAHQISDHARVAERTRGLAHH